MVHRHPVDRLASRVVKMHRYRCPDDDCGWEGLQRSSRDRPRLGDKRWILAVIAILAAFAAWLIVTIL